jgi:hypothetical protein
MIETPFEFCMVCIPQEIEESRLGCNHTLNIFIIYIQNEFPVFSAHVIPPYPCSTELLLPKVLPIPPFGIRQTREHQV